MLRPIVSPICICTKSMSKRTKMKNNIISEDEAKDKKKSQYVKASSKSPYQS
jgi:hypothetical protein